MTNSPRTSFYYLDIFIPLTSTLDIFIALTSTVSVSSPAVMALIITQGCGLTMNNAGFFHAILYLK
jgi:hypothetical protein